MDTVPILIQEKHGLTRTSRPVKLGIPFPRGRIANLQQLELLNDEGVSIPFQSSITAHWDGQSIRWTLIDFFVSIEANQEIQYQLNIVPGATHNHIQKALSFSENEQEIIVTTGVATFHIDKNTFAPFNRITTAQSDKVIEHSKTTLLDASNSALQAKIEKVTYPDPGSNSRLTFQFEGIFGTGEKRDLRFQASLSFFTLSALCELEFTLHNPNRAMHKGGFWDLGDEGSIFFNSLKISLGLTEIPEGFCKNLEDNSTTNIDGKSIRLYQDSSGGENWNHHIHINKDGESTVSFKGYQVTSNDETICEGLRASPVFQVKTDNAGIQVGIKKFWQNFLIPTCMPASPVFQVKTDNAGIQVGIKKFWQNFPKALSVDNQKLNVELFPVTAKKGLYELQGGEQKNHTVLLNFSNQIDTIEEYLSPLNITLPLKYYHYSNAMPWLSETQQTTPIDKTIEEGLTGERNFFWKREKSDEYGWRNFGELWADHETLEHGNDDSLISHYNNQYDPIYGFSRQYIVSGDLRWLELADDLARHVVDIDIYHTDQDRLEYNQGLFWHTDHYLDGRYCTHRTFSKHHMAIGHVEQSGGGPGTEHCYSTGIAYQYYLTGDLRYKNILLKMEEWIRYTMEGGNTVLEHVKKTLALDIQQVKMIRNGEKIPDYKYPLSRATGNYLSTLIDAYDVSSDNSYLNRAGKIIRNTINPNDDISLRHLENVESNWSYTVLLQSVAKYLHCKFSNNQFDDDFVFAYQSFFHYLDSMLENEDFYLDKPEILVYPNSTWPAQDVRKAQLFYVGFLFSKEPKYFLTSNHYLEYLTQNLNSEDVYKSSRILAILMQSYWGLNTYHNTYLVPKSVTKSILSKLFPKPKLKTYKSIFLSAVSGYFQRLIEISISAEIRWVKLRISLTFR